ncbi:RfaL [Desulforapulum autotrophicum HRM2]|uniref:RfaL n=1 Tax=Desulforapulum autotrophicum (strain ATCC 43914 / DSM 3382 / VKM B-1955 / HRM2) TaxID=177437 RepID=C0QCL9_DESAH|nr:O-antigen ligase family protein [Desulforapulum autotrophicum]ACN15096.1 RfaL [Desulforapulum autotrophicum HRM2]
MFSLKPILFISLFLICTCGAVFLPHLGVYGYIADYCIGPSQQWWEAPFSGIGIRYSFSLALATILGFVLQRHKLRFGFSAIQRQETLLLLFLCVIWLSSIFGVSTVDRYSTVDHPTVKFTKVVVFIFLMTHIITDKNKFNGLFWVFVMCALVLGLQAWELPRRSFIAGRLEGIGGADFAESNFFGSFMAAMLPLIGVQLLRSKKWILKIVCLVAAAFTANAVVLCRSRGALVGIAMGCFAAMLMAPKQYKKKIAIGLVLGVLGGLYVTDQQFLERMTSIVVSEEEERDESAASRFRLWQAGAQMVSDHPLGIGIGNWYQTIVIYIPEYEGKDSHNTYVKCVAELGIQGLFLFALIIFFALKENSRIKAMSDRLPPEIANDFIILSFGLCISIVIILTCGLTITMIYTEIIWILLMLPVCLRRALENAIMEYETEVTEVTMVS